MSKHTYRAVAVNEKLLEYLDREVVRSERLIFAIDVAKVDIKAAIIQGERVLRTIGWKAPLETMNFVELVSTMKGLGPVEVVMESTGTYGDPLREQMAKLEVPVFRVSAKHTHDAAELFDGVPSMHDAKAAHLLGWLHIQKRSRSWEIRSDEVRDAAAAAANYELYNSQFMACLGRLEAIIARHFPELPEVVSLQNKSTLSLLATYGDPRWISINAPAATKLMLDIGGRLLDPEKVANVMSAARKTTGMRMTSGERALLMQLAKEADHQRTLKASAHDTLEKCVSKNSEIMRVGEVVGVATAALVWAETGNVSDYASPAAYVKTLGLNLKVRSSGKHEGQLKITKRGPALARKYLYLAVLRLIQSEPHFKAWYARKVEREGGKRKLKAVTALMRKLASALWYVARGAQFEAAKLFDSQRLGLPA